MNSTLRLVVALCMAALCHSAIGCSSEDTLSADPTDATSGSDMATVSEHPDVGDPNAVWCSSTQTENDLCDDSNLCTQNDTCRASHQCVGSNIACYDGNACTTDSCDPKTGCTFPMIIQEIPCNDGNACTTDDHCNGSGSCVMAEKLECLDSNDCTDDSCDIKKGCLFIAKGGAPCNDGDKCTAGDACVTDQCKPGPPKNCDDANVCTENSCDGATGKCHFTPTSDGTICTDGDGCTDGDACKGGACVPGQKKECKKDDACKVGVCSSASGNCAYTYVGTYTTPCSDGDACSIEDKCNPALGVCLGTSIQNCNDGNPCTEDSCDQYLGCVHKQNDSLQCTDGNLCTPDDKCKAGTCVAGTLKSCNDNNECTSDGCNPTDGSCTFATKVGKQCDDSDFCTDGDKCDQLGKCSGNPVFCDDKNECTSDSCKAVSGCQSIAIPGKQCDDGNACTDSDQCSGGKCNGKTKTCDDFNQCTADSCNPVTGVCNNVPYQENAPCSDGNPCTPTDLCDTGGKCVGYGAKCNDKNLCTIDSCNPVNGSCSYPLDPNKPDCKP